MKNGKNKQTSSTYGGFFPFSRGVKQKAELTAELCIAVLQEPPQQNVTPSQLVGLVPLGKAYLGSISPERE